MFNSPNKSIGVIKGIESAPGKNILINGNFTVNQYGSDLDLQYAAASVDNYYVDRWIKKASNRITQKVEEGNYEPNTQYTLSCYRQDGSRDSVTANSPASGHWDIATTHSGINLYFTDRKIQLEKGDTATDFELEDIGTTLAKCQRYYERSGKLSATGFTETTPVTWCCVCTWNYSVKKRIDQPTINKISGPTGAQNVGTPYGYPFASFESAAIVAEATGTGSGGRTYFKEAEFYSDAEL